MSAPIPSVSVVDDDASVRIAVARLMRAAGFQVSLHASAQDYLGGYDPDTPGCVVLDLTMPGLDGLALQSELICRGRPPPIIFLTGQADVAASVLAMKRGAVEFLCKPADESILVGAVRSALETDRIERIERAEQAELRSRLSTLTARESQVLGYLVAGKANKFIAAELGTVEKTIKVHRARVMEKMRVRSIAALVRIIVRLEAAARSPSHN